MRICLISREFPPDTGWGGIATFVHDLALGLAEIGAEVEVIALSADGKNSTVDYKGIKLHRVAPVADLDKYQMLLSLMPYSHSLLKSLVALHLKFVELHSAKPFDIVEVPEMFGEGVFLALTKLCPLVIRLYTPHFKFIDEKLHLIDEGFDHQLLSIIEKLTLLNADAVVSPSQDLGDYVANAIGFSSEEMHIMKGLVDTNRFTPEGAQALKIEEAVLKVILVGRLEERKGVYQLIRAIPQVVKKFPKVKFFLIGKDTNTAHGGKSVQAELEAELKKSGCGQHVVFTGPVPHASMPEYFRSADIFVLPSLYDNAPLTCLEALSSGTAIIGTSAGGMKEYVQNGKSGIIIPPSDVQALSDALLELLSDKAKRESFGREARKSALELYDRKITARASLKLYEQAIVDFQRNKLKALVRTDKDSILQSSQHLMAKFDEMVYAFLYKRSLTFRLSYWFHMCKDRPKLFSATVLVNAADKLAGALKLKDKPAVIKKLEAEIKRQPVGAGRS